MIPSAIRGRDAGLTFPLHIDFNEMLTTAKHDFSKLTSVSEDTLKHHIQALPPQFDEFFKHVAEDLKTNTEIIVSKLHEIDWADKQSIMGGLQPILDFLQPVFKFVKAHPWILIPLVIPVLEFFIGLLGFEAGYVSAGMFRTVFYNYSLYYKPIVPD